MFTHEEAMLPILRRLQDRQILKRPELYLAMADHFALSEEERRELLPSGRELRCNSRVGWALTHLVRANLIARPKRGSYQITEAGIELLDRGVASLSTLDLRSSSATFDAWFVESVQGEQSAPFDDDSHIATSGSYDSPAVPPQEALERAHAALQRALVSEILETLDSCSPGFFEDLVLKLLLKMGYGGSSTDAARSVERNGDGSIHGIIKGDRLGLDAIYVQTERRQIHSASSVGRTEVQAFVGALTGHRTRKGVFITTTSYSREAREYVQNLEAKVALIDGTTLAKYMIEFDMGVSLVETYAVKRLDSDFFDE